jgi:hypothetical protein
MIDRRVYFMPISRSLKLGIKEALQIRKIYEECKRVGGIFLVQPEHMLSFELLGLDRVLSDAPGREIKGNAGNLSATDDDALIEVTPGMVMVDTQRTWILCSHFPC